MSKYTILNKASEEILEEGVTIMHVCNQSTMPIHISWLFMIWLGSCSFCGTRRARSCYQLLILGFTKVRERLETIIQCLVCPVKWSTVKNNMLVWFTLGIQSASIVRVPLSSFVFTLCIIKDYGGGRIGLGSHFGKDSVRMDKNYN